MIKIPLIEYPGYVLDRDNQIRSIARNGQRLVINTRDFKTPRIELKDRTGNKHWFKVWFLVSTAKSGVTSRWDIRGYNLFKRCWQPKFKDGDILNFSCSNFRIVEREPISIYNIVEENIEYKWWSDYVSGPEVQVDFDDCLVKQIIARKFRLSNNTRIKKFFGKMFGRGRAEVERVIHPAVTSHTGISLEKKFVN